MTKSSGKLNVVYCAYRDWALSIAAPLKEHPKVAGFELITSREDFDQRLKLDLKPDLAFFVGWSWIIPRIFFENVLCVGMHPSDLPLYRGGSPLQHQILDGLTDSMASLFTITAELDAGPIWIKEPFSLRGNNMKEILRDLSLSTQRALFRFLDAYPGITCLPNAAKEPALKRRKPEQSILYPQDFQNKSAKELYDFIRALTDPYPNAYLQDATGDKLFFKEVAFEASANKENPADVRGSSASSPTRNR